MPPARLIDSLSRNRKQFCHRLANAASSPSVIFVVVLPILENLFSFVISRRQIERGFIHSPLVRRCFTLTLVQLAPGKPSPGLAPARGPQRERGGISKGVGHKNWVSSLLSKEKGKRVAVMDSESLNFFANPRISVRISFLTQLDCMIYYLEHETRAFYHSVQCARMENWAYIR